MAMLNHGGDEAANAAEYMEDYMDYVENVPHDIQRHVTQYRQLDLEYQEMLQELDQYQNTLLRDLDVTGTKRAMLQMQRCLIRAQEIADDKLKTTQAIQDIVENKSRQLEVDLQKLDLGRENEVQNENHKTEVQPERTSKRSRRSRQMDVSLKEDIVHERQEKEIVVPSTSKKQKKKKRKSKVEKEQVTSPVDPPIDPNEPTYCLCDQVSFGEMIGCDNEDCLREWFHFSCVGLTTKPKGKWYCPQCRGDRSNQMKAKFA